MRRVSACHQRECFNPACSITDIFVLTGNIGGHGRGKRRTGRSDRLQEPKGWQGEGDGAGGRNKDREGRKSGKQGAETRTMAEMTATTVQARGGRGQYQHQVSSAGAGGEYCAGRADEKESVD